MDAARDLFARAGRSEHLHTEAFTLAQFTAEAGTVDGTVRFGASEIGVASDGTPLLLQAEAAGLVPLTGCRMGICHTCTRRLCAGVVRDAVTGDLTNGPDVNIRICVSVPVGDVEIDSRDRCPPSPKPTASPRPNSMPSNSELETLRAEVAGAAGGRGRGLHPPPHPDTALGRSHRPGLAVPGLPPPVLVRSGRAPSRSRRSSTTWRSGTTSCTASTTGRRIPALSSTDFEWDSSCPAKGWQHYHNYLHHTFTNITDKDRDLGYGVIRISAEKPWTPANLGNPLYALGLALIFDHGIMLHDVDFGHVRAGKKSWAEAKLSLKNGMRKSGTLAFRDYIMWPAFTGPLFFFTLAANAAGQCGPQHLGLHHHLLRALPQGRAGIHRRGVRRRVEGPLVLPPDARLGQHQRGRPVPHHVRQPQLPDRAPSLPRHPGPALPADRPPGARDLPALRDPLQHGPALPAIRVGHRQDLPLRPPGPRKACADGAPSTPGEDAGRAHGGLKSLPHAAEASLV